MRVSPSSARSVLPAAPRAAPRCSRPPARPALPWRSPASPAGAPRCTPPFREAFSWDEVFGDDDKEEEVVLQAYQEERLRQELGVGRRKFNVTTVSRELNLDRGEVLAWLKQNARTAQTQTPGAGTKLARSPAAAPHRESPLEQVRPRRVPAPKEAPARDTPPPPRRLSKEEFHASLPPRVAFWKTFRKTRMGRDQRDTLERVYNETRFPSDDLIASMYDLVRLQRDEVIQWFTDRRVADAQASAARRGDVRGRRPRPDGSSGGDGEQHTLRASMAAMRPRRGEDGYVAVKGDDGRREFVSRAGGAADGRDGQERPPARAREGFNREEEEERPRAARVPKRWTPGGRERRERRERR